MTKRNKAILLAAAGVGGWVALRALRPMYNLRGRNVLITGGSRGLGLVIARECIRHGARVAVCARDPDELKRAHDDLASRGGFVYSAPCDLTDRDMVKQMIDNLRQAWGPIDVLINNAGTIAVGPIESMGVEDIEEAMRSNFWSAVYATQAVLPDMLRRGNGRIVNITSIGGKISVPHLLPYCASKFALVGFSEGLHAEVKRRGITVTTVVPGLMRTGSPRNADFKGQHRAEFTWFNVSDTLPIISTSAESAARQIVNGCCRGDAEVIVTLPAQIAVRLHDLMPGITNAVLALVCRLLPGPGGIGTERAKGRESQSAASASWLTALGDEAAERNNEITPEEMMAMSAHGRKRFAI